VVALDASVFMVSKTQNAKNLPFRPILFYEIGIQRG
jgi:hypothetical protein